MYHQRKFLESRREPAAWADIAEDGREGPQLHSVPVLTQLAGDRARKGRLHWALPPPKATVRLLLSSIQEEIV